MTARFHLPLVAATARPAGEISPGAPLGDPLIDAFARRVRYLRVSVTDRCNFRCTYCLPEDADDTVAFQPRAALLTFEEIEQIVRVFVGLGVRKVRLTGGEPTVRSHIVELVGRLARLPGLEQLVMTTNGHRLGDLAGPLVAAGLTGCNVSLDTVDAARFHRLTGRGELAPVLAGIAAARAAGLPVKLNAVAIADEGATAEAADADVLALCAYAWDHGLPLRFIEPMPMSSARFFTPARARSAASLRALIAAHHGELVPVVDAARDAGPARIWQLAADPTRTVGIISAITEHFCDDCNRLRLSATGDLHACLGHDEAVSLRDVVRAGGEPAAVAHALGHAIGQAVGGKRAGHEFSPAGAGAPAKHMIAIGG